MNLKISKEINYKTITEEERKTIRRRHLFKCFMMVITGSILYSIGVVWILRLGGFFSGGVTGASQLIVGMFEKFSSNTNLINIMSNNLGTFVLLLNIPLLMFGWKGVSKQFAVLTLVSIVLQTIILNLLSQFTVSPFISFLGEGTGSGAGLIDIFKTGDIMFAKTAESSLIQEGFKQSMSVGTRLMLAIAGGAVCGCGASLCLKGGGSTGGMDIIANFLQLKKQIPFTKYQGMVDGTIILLSSLISVENVIFTLVRLAIYMKTLGAFYKIYKTNRIEVVTTHGEEIRDELLKNFNHSMTLYNCIGGYTKCGKETIVVYASNFEVEIYISIIKSFDPQAFITISHARIEKSNYVQKTII